MTSKLPKPLLWPKESARPVGSDALDWHHAATNICLDFHGDPTRAKLTVFSDGNHHMALEACCQDFLQKHPDVGDIFYATTPPHVLVNAVEKGSIQLGNLHLPARPDIFISPENIMQNLKSASVVDSYRTFASSKGNVLLVLQPNPKNIQNIDDLLRNDVTLFCSNPDTEKASYQVYRDTVLDICNERNIPAKPYKALFDGQSSRTCFGQLIHHREAPQALYDKRADVAVIYYHLALRYCRIFNDTFAMLPLIESESESNFSAANIKTPYFIGIVNQENEWARLFHDYMLSPDAQSLYQHHGLL